MVPRLRFFAAATAKLKKNSMLSPFRDAKRQGELAELVFAARAAKLGWQVSKPYGESSAYDFVVDAGGKLWRVQVKSVAAERDGTYRIASSGGGGSKHTYTEDDIDLLAAYVIPEDAWYLIPVECCATKSIHLCPHRPSKRKFERFREAWELLAGGSEDIAGENDQTPHLQPLAM